jgi:hypothetical protein
MMQGIVYPEMIQRTLPDKGKRDIGADLKKKCNQYPEGLNIAEQKQKVRQLSKMANGKDKCRQKEQTRKEPFIKVLLHNDIHFQ